jgi:hypothetical protein
LDPGHGPVQVETIQAKIKIRTSIRNLHVLVINPQGNIMASAQTEYRNGVFMFEIGKMHPEYPPPATRDPVSMYYLIEAW